MNRQECKEAAVRLLRKAEASSQHTITEEYTNMARVYAMLAAIPDEQDMRGEIYDRRPDGPGDVSGRIGR